MNIESLKASGDVDGLVVALSNRNPSVEVSATPAFAILDDTAC